VPDPFFSSLPFLFFFFLSFFLPFFSRLSLSLSLSFSFFLYLSFFLSRTRAVCVPSEFVNSFRFRLTTAFAFRLVCEAFVTVGDVRIARVCGRVPYRVTAKSACLSTRPSLRRRSRARGAARSLATSFLARLDATDLRKNCDTQDTCACVRICTCMFLQLVKDS